MANDGDPLAIAPARFRQQMDFLAADGYRVVDVVEALEMLDRGAGAPAHPRPELRRRLRRRPRRGAAGARGAPLTATVFVMTGVTGGRHSFAWYARQPHVLDWDAVQKLDRHGTLRFEAHTVSHPNLLAVDDAAAWAEIRDSRALRRRQINSRDRLVDFRAKVGGGHDTPLPLRGAYRRLRYGMGAGRPARASSRA